MLQHRPFESSPGEIVPKPGDTIKVGAASRLDPASGRASRVDPAFGYGGVSYPSSGFSVGEIAEALEISERSVHREWTFARARLFEIIGEN